MDLPEMNTVHRVFRTIKTGCGLLKRFLTEGIFVSAFELYKARRKILKQITDSDCAYPDEAGALQGVAESLTIDDIKRHLTFEAERRKSIEDKAKANLIAITIGFTVLFAGLTFFQTKQASDLLSTSGARFLSGMMLVAGVVYMIYGGLMALDALRIARTYSPSPEDEAGATEREKCTKMLWCLRQNQRTTLLRTNSLERVVNF
jgi:hypothetical protein